MSLCHNQKQLFGNFFNNTFSSYIIRWESRTKISSLIWPVCETIFYGIILNAKGPHIQNLQLRASYSTIFKTLLDNVIAKKNYLKTKMNSASDFGAIGKNLNK